MTSDPAPDRADQAPGQSSTSGGQDAERPVDNSPLLEPTPEEGAEPDKTNVGASTPDEA